MSNIMIIALLLCSAMVAAGFVIIDDYKLPGCRTVIDAFRAQERSKNPINFADEKAGVVFWCK
ncbi:TylF/MycF/NovP-related O-methyltransferase [Bartonella mastomydis]|uniref:TylF/MycF/NovP-related O-methyltransferase n=1 Tax=Bartonella mastomydis TaxID=1820002 RepID=UPI001116E66B|nr:TylF/MycF/NovP-related O-methyltransferase [Bartonella mastomydis]